MTTEDTGRAAQPGTPAPEPSDHSLLRRLRGGDQDAATRLYMRYAHRLLALARKNRSAELASRVDAEDIVQSVFRIFFRGAATGHYDVPRGEDLWKVLLVIALNKIRGERVFHRAAKRDARLTTGGGAVAGAGASRADDPEAFLEVVVAEALGRLPPQHRGMVELRIQGFEVAEIADRVGRSKRTVERVLQESRKQLRELLQQEG
jgi:RNA polymerase sigma-70 factor, ECF subfamily